MPKTLVAKNVASVNPLQFVWKEGAIVGLLVTCEINFGETGLQYQVDIWEDLTATQKQKAIAIYNRVKDLIEAKFIGSD